jgi:hypothetical protein
MHFVQLLNRGAAVKSTTDGKDAHPFVRRKGSAAEGMILQIIPGRADKIRTTVAFLRRAMELIVSLFGY